MDRQAAKVERGEHDVDLSTFHQATGPRRDLGGKRRGVGDRDRQRQCALEVAAAGPVIDPRVRRADADLLAGQLAGDGADASDLLGGDAHGGVRVVRSRWLPLVRRDA